MEVYTSQLAQYELALDFTRVGAGSSFSLVLAFIVHLGKSSFLHVEGELSQLQDAFFALVAYDDAREWVCRNYSMLEATYLR